MRRRRLIVLVIALMALAGAGAFAYVSSTGVHGSARQTAMAYFKAWQDGSPDRMYEMVSDPPADFVQRHLGLSEELRVKKIELSPGALKNTGDDSAEIPFTGVRTLADMGPWPFDGVLRLAVRERRWKVLWSPETLHPALKDGGALTLDKIKVPGIDLVTKSGVTMPLNSGAEPYLRELNERLGTMKTGWAINARSASGKARRLVVYQPPPARQVRTTLSRPVQAAAARALDGVRRPAAIVAVRAGTGEILAIADRLSGERSALETFYPLGQLGQAVAPALTWGFDEKGMATGVGGLCGYLSAEDLAAHSVAEAKATPLCMAVLAAAVDGGTWHAPRLVTAKAAKKLDGAPPAERSLDARTGDGLRAAMRQVAGGGAPAEGVVATDGGADAVGGGAVGTWPAGVFSEYGSARDAEGGRNHVWLIGYQGDVAFSVLVENGGSANASVLPIAIRFVRAL